MSKNFVSIIIVTLNRKKELVNCINSITKQKYNYFEVIVIDNNSSDGSVEELRKKYPFVRIFKTKKNLGTSYTRNAALIFSRGDIVWFLDSDVYLNDKNIMKQMVKKIINGKDALGGEAILNNQDEIVGNKKLILYPNGMIKGQIYLNNKDSKTKVLPTCNLMIKKNCIIDIGGFDHFYFFYLEDLDLTLRLNNSGYSLYSLGNCGVVHYFSKKTRFNNLYISGKNRTYFVLKNLGIINLLLLPFLDLIYIFDFKNLFKIYNKVLSDDRIENSRIKIKNKNFSFFSLKNVFFLIINKFLSMMYSYIFIPYFLIRSKSIRRKINFLNLVNISDFKKIS